MTTFRRLLSDFSNDRDGTVAILFGLSCVVLLGLVGLAIDTSRYYNYSARMQQALDAAALAGAKMLPDSNASDGDIRAMVLAHFNSSMSKTGVTATSLQSPKIKIDRSAKSVEVIGAAKLPSLFSRFVMDPNKVNVDLAAKVVFDMKNIELSMVLDITGSMNARNKISDLKVAAKDIVDELYNSALSDEGVRIALAPYSASVNAGSLASAVTNVAVTTSCSWEWWRWKCRDTSGVDQDTCVVERQGPQAATDAAPVGTDKLPNVPTVPYGNYVCPPSTVLGLQGRTQRDTVMSTIDSYIAAGATAGHIGTAWGWYLLSPEWSSVLGASAPKPYTDNDVEKSVIIMTDGMFNTSYLTGGSTPPSTQTNESYAQFDALCAGMKAKNIKIYTVGFDLNDARALSELQGCASEPNNFFDAKTGAQLKKAFKDIANKLNTLRVAS